MPATLLARAMNRSAQWSVPHALPDSSLPAASDCVVGGMKAFALSLTATHLAASQAQHASASSLRRTFDLRQAERGNSGTPFLQIAHDCAARGWPFRYGCFGVSRYSNTRALFERAAKLGVAVVLDEQMQSAQHALAAFVAGVDHVYLTFCLDVLPASIALGVSAPAVRGVGLDIVEPLIDLVIKPQSSLADMPK